MPRQKEHDKENENPAQIYVRPACTTTVWQSHEHAESHTHCQALTKQQHLCDQALQHGHGVIRQLSQERRGQRRSTVPHYKTYALIRASVKRGYSSSVNENRKGIPEHAGTRTYRRRASEGRLGIQGYKTNTKR